MTDLGFAPCFPKSESSGCPPYTSLLFKTIGRKPGFLECCWELISTFLRFCEGGRGRSLESLWWQKFPRSHIWGVIFQIYFLKEFQRWTPLLRQVLSTLGFHSGGLLRSQHPGALSVALPLRSAMSFNSQMNCTISMHISNPNHSNINVKMKD